MAWCPDGELGIASTEVGRQIAACDLDRRPPQRMRCSLPLATGHGDVTVLVDAALDAHAGRAGA